MKGTETRNRHLFSVILMILDNKSLSNDFDLSVICFSVQVSSLMGLSQFYGKYSNDLLKLFQFILCK